MADQDKDALLAFLDYASEKGLMKKGTAQSLKSACNAVFSILNEDEEKDLFALDMEGMFQRFENLKGQSVTPSTMKTYRQRVKQAVSDFQRFRENPSGWKPARARRTNDGNKRTVKGGATVQEEISVESQSGTVTNEPVSVDSITHQFPLRRDVIVKITGIPFDVTKAEMGRMNAFLSNLVAVTDDLEPTHLMLNAPDPEIV